MYELTSQQQIDLYAYLLADGNSPAEAQQIVQALANKYGVPCYIPCIP